jgi:hypothetical protein
MPDALILHIGNEQPTATIETTVVRLAQLGACPRTTIATRPRLAGPGHGRDDACGRLDLPDDCIQPVHDVDVAVGVDL